MKFISIIFFSLFYLSSISQSNDSLEFKIHPETFLFSGNRIAEVYENGFVYKGLTSDSAEIVYEGIWVQLDQNGDTLWYTKYGFQKPYVLSGFSYLPVLKEVGKIYFMSEVDDLPKENNNQIVDKIRKQHTKYCYGSAGFEGVRTMQFTVDTMGQIWNIEQHQGCEEFYRCPFYLQELMLEISSWEPLQPAVKDGVKVNVEMIIPIDNLNQYLNQCANHPAFDEPLKSFYGIPLFDKRWFVRW